MQGGNRDRIKEMRGTRRYTARYAMTLGGDRTFKLKGSRVLTKAESALDHKYLEGETHIHSELVSGGLTDHPPRPPCFAHSQSENLRVADPASVSLADVCVLLSLLPCHCHCHEAGKTWVFQVPRWRWQAPPPTKIQFWPPKLPLSKPRVTCSVQVQQPSFPSPSRATHCGLKTYLCTLWGLHGEQFQTQNKALTRCLECKAQLG